jgi:hypothetical protein
MYTASFRVEKDEKLSSRIISMVVNIFTTGFSFDAQETQYSWSSVVGEEMAFALDHCLLTPAIDKLLSTGRVVYYEGGVVIELRDYRHNRDSDLCPYDGTPAIYRLELRPNQQTLFADLESRFGNRGDDLVVKVEEVVLRSLHPICIDNSPQVFFHMNNVHYNQHKFNYYPSNGQRAINNRLIAKRKRISIPSQATNEPRRKRQRLGVVPFLQRVGQKPGIIPLIEPDFHKQQLDLVNDLEKKFEKAAVRSPTPTVSITRKPHTELAVPSAHSNLLTKRTIRFLVNKGQDFVMFEVIPKPNGCYDGRLRVGTFPDTGFNGEFSERFSIGNTKTALSFIHNLRDLEYQESNSNGDNNIPQQTVYPNMRNNRSPMIAKPGQPLQHSPQTPDQKALIAARPPAIPANPPLAMPVGVLHSPSGGLRQSPHEESMPPMPLPPPPYVPPPIPNGIPPNMMPVAPNMTGPTLLQPGALHPNAQRMGLVQPSQPQSPQQPHSPQQMIQPPVMGGRTKSFMGVPPPVTGTGVVMNQPPTASPQHTSPRNMSPEHVMPTITEPSSPPSEDDSDSRRSRVSSSRGRGRVRGSTTGRTRGRGRPSNASLAAEAAANSAATSETVSSPGTQPTTPPKRGRTRGRPKKT